MTQPGKDGSAAEELEALHQEDKNWMERWQTAFEESFSKVAAEASVQVTALNCAESSYVIETMIHVMQIKGRGVLLYG